MKAPLVVVLAVSLAVATYGSIEADEARDRWQDRIPSEAYKLNEEGALLARQGQYDASIAKFEQALKIKPDYIAALFNVGLARDFREGKGDQQAAEAAFRKAIEVGEAQSVRDLVPLYNTLGWFLHLRGRLEEAKDWYKKALKIDPKSPRVLNNLGAVHEWSGDREAARGLYKEAVDAGSEKARDNLKRLQRVAP